MKRGKTNRDDVRPRARVCVFLTSIDDANRMALERRMVCRSGQHCVFVCVVCVFSHSASTALTGWPMKERQS